MLTKLLGIIVVIAAGCLVPLAGAHAQYGGGGAVDCESRNYGYNRCEAPGRDVELVRNLSGTRCVRGQNWGVDRKGIWVDRGCSGRFVASGDGHRPGPGPGPGGPWNPGPGWDQRFSITCESQDGRDRFCSVDLGGGGRAYLERQTSSTPCVEGRNWGWNRGGVWVTGGCRGTFSVDRRWR